MIITLAGPPGSGKSTVKEALAAKLGLKKYSMGDMRGKMAVARGMTIDEFNKLGETESFTDTEADAFQTELGKNEDDFVIDGRVSFHFIPNSVKVLLTVDPAEGAKRVFAARKAAKAGREDEREYGSVEETQRVLEARMASDRVRYGKWYGIDCYDPKNFELVIDTTYLRPEETLAKVLDYVHAHATKKTAS